MLIRRRPVLTDTPVNFPPSGDNSTGVSGNKRKKIGEGVADGPLESKKARREPTLLDALFDLPNELSQEVLANSYFIGYEIFIKPNFIDIRPLGATRSLTPIPHLETVREIFPRSGFSCTNLATVSVQFCARLAGMSPRPDGAFLHRASLR